MHGTDATKDLCCLQVNGVQLSGIPKHKATGWASYQWVMDAGTTWYGSGRIPVSTTTFARPWDEVPERHVLIPGSPLIRRISVGVHRCSLTMY